ncbi:MAG: heparan-alpha-glucosaminide N-acetyltransferase [Candidatus Methanospirareceae archaeon]
MTQQLDERFWEIDLLRGVAILMMIFYHVLYDLDRFSGLGIEIHTVFWRLFAVATASLFLLLVGVSLTLSYARASHTSSEPRLFPKYLNRGARIFAWALLITTVTWVLLGDGFVRWGILHLIGLAIIMAFPLLKLRYVNLALGSLFLLLGVLIRNLRVGSSWLLWLGFMPAQFTSVDYFPVLPWFGVVLIGIFVGNSLYPCYHRKFRLQDRSHVTVIRGLNFLGRHSLLIYLVHQPVLIAMLFLVGAVDIGALTGL